MIKKVLEEEKLETRMAISKQNNLVKENDKLNSDNKSMMLDLFEKSEYEKVNKEQILNLKIKIQDLENQTNSASSGDMKKAQEKISGYLLPDLIPFMV